MATQLSKQQIHDLEIIERVASCISIIGTSFVFTTFIYSPAFRKPINRLIFYASWGNMLCNIATLIAQTGIRAGRDSHLCQFQGFLIQMYGFEMNDRYQKLIHNRFLPADAFWNLAMAINVYLTILHRFSASRLRKLEWIYLLMCYGITFVVALICLFVSTPSRGKIYGPNILWCSIDIKWVFLRVAIVYGPAWICIATSLFLYVISGIEIFRKRAQLIAFKPPQSRSDLKPGYVEDPASDFKTTNIRVSSEPAAFLSPSEGSHDTTSTTESNSTGSPALYTSQKYPSYFVTTISSASSGSRSEHEIPALPQSPKSTQQRRQSRAAAEFNKAALGYTKVAVLFFCSLLITWVPPSVNRFNSFLHPHEINIPSSYATSFVLPMMGAWNSVIYIVTSWRAVRDLFSGKLERPRLGRAPSSDCSVPGRYSSNIRKGSESEETQISCV